LDPAVDRRVVNAQSALGHHLFEIAVAERIPQVPADTQQNDLGLKMTPFERTRIAHARNSSAVLEIKQSLPERQYVCNRTFQGIYHKARERRSLLQ
jgi:hypothetical protein